MNTAINMTAIYISNAIGIVLMLMILYSNRWRFKVKTEENKFLLLMIFNGMFACGLDILTFTMDGRPGTFSRIICYTVNALVYFANVIMGSCWISLLSRHLNIHIGKTHHRILVAANLLCSAVLVINIFIPILFTLDEANVYHRGPLFMLFLVVAAFLLADGIVIYMRTKRRSGFLKFFPVTSFCIPVVIGAAIQTLEYGVSTIWPFVAVSVSSLMASLQNEIIFQDQLTGLYSRYYLDHLKRRTMSEDNALLTAMMLDLNGFKQINDKHGHLIGDQALRETAGILTRCVNDQGVVIRYAGDEFVILLNTLDPERVNECIRQIRSSMEEFNRTSGKPYKLSVSIGTCTLNLKEQSVDMLMNEADRIMYEDKKIYYQQNPELNRRIAED